MRIRRINSSRYSMCCLPRSTRPRGSLQLHVWNLPGNRMRWRRLSDWRCIALPKRGQLSGRGLSGTLISHGHFFGRSRSATVTRGPSWKCSTRANGAARPRLAVLPASRGRADDADKDVVPTFAERTLRASVIGGPGARADGRGPLRTPCGRSA